MAKSNNRKWIFIGLGSFVLLMALLLIFRKGDTKPFVNTGKVSLQNITETVSANGTIQPEVEVKISSEVSGEIVALLIREGDSVKKGQLLLQVNPDISESNVERARASVENARANQAAAEARLQQAIARFGQVKISYERNKKLYADKVIPASEFELAEAEYLNAGAEVDASNKAVDAARYTVKSLESTLSGEIKTLKRTSIFSPMDGIVSKLSVEQGERVVGTMQMTGTELLRIADFSSMELRVDVGESDIIRVSVGDTATIEVDAYDKKEFTGIVKEVANSAKNSGTAGTTDQVTNFEVRIHILRNSYNDLTEKYAHKASPFLPGMSGIAEIKTSSSYNAVAVPIEAVTTRKDRADSSTDGRAKEIVFKFAGGKAVATIVKTGIQDSRYIQVLEGLKEGDEVITGPYGMVSRTLTDGMEVSAGTENKKHIKIKPDQKN
jgi:HlyD family secretion protein